MVENYDTLQIAQVARMLEKTGNFDLLAVLSENCRKMAFQVGFAKLSIYDEDGELCFCNFCENLEDARKWAKAYKENCECTCVIEY